MPVGVRSFVQQDLDEEDILAEPEQDELSISTQMFNGWRCSCRRANAHCVQHMEYPGKLHASNPDLSTRLQDGELSGHLNGMRSALMHARLLEWLATEPLNLQQAAAELPVLAGVDTCLRCI